MPAIVGAAQVVQRPGARRDASEARGPIELMADAARRAAEDAGAAALLDQVGWIGVVAGWWRYRNPGRLVAQQIGSPNARTALTAITGTAPQDLVGLAAARIARGELDVALVVGGEARWSQQQMKRSGENPSWNSEAGEGAPEVVSGFPDEMIEEARTFGAAAPAYALFDDSRRAADGESLDEHRDRIAELWAGFNSVAVDNPYAWDRVPRTAAQIREPTADNRMIAFPYTKAMVANNTVDMASAILLCSAAAAAAARVPSDRLVFPHASTTSHDTWMVVNRNVLHRAPAIVAGGRAALQHAGCGIDDIEHVDLYACFPSIVKMSADALGLDDRRALTVTGGLGFGGAPVANASGHSIAAMVPLVRNGGVGLVHANGGFATKHAFGVYSNRPPKQFVRVDCEDAVQHDARDAMDDGWKGKVTIEAATVVFDREGPSHVLAAGLTDRGERGWMTSREADVISRAMSAGLAREAADRTAEAEFRL